MAPNQHVIHQDSKGEAAGGPQWSGSAARTAPQQPSSVCSCPRQAARCCPPLRPTPHQVQRRTAAQILHDDPQLRALGSEKHLSARDREQSGTAGPGPQDTHSPAAVTWPSSPSGTHHKRAPPAPFSSPPIKPPMQPLCRWTSGQVHYADTPSKTRPGKWQVQLALGPPVPAPQASPFPLGRTPRNWHSPGIWLQGA